MAMIVYNGGEPNRGGRRSGRYHDAAHSDEEHSDDDVSTSEDSDCSSSSDEDEDEDASSDEECGTSVKKRENPEPSPEENLSSALQKILNLFTGSGGSDRDSSEMVQCLKEHNVPSKIALIQLSMAQLKTKQLIGLPMSKDEMTKFQEQMVDFVGSMATLLVTYTKSYDALDEIMGSLTGIGNQT